MSKTFTLERKIGLTNRLQELTISGVKDISATQYLVDFVQFRGDDDSFSEADQRWGNFNVDFTEPESEF